MVTVAVLKALPDVAVIVTDPGVVDAVKVAVAIPLDVFAEAVMVLPRFGELNVKVTIVPSATFAPSLSSTVAVMVDVPFTEIEAGLAATVTAGCPDVPPDPPPPRILLPDPP
jgi:hypothetical protein